MEDKDRDLTLQDLVEEYRAKGMTIMEATAAAKEFLKRYELQETAEDGVFEIED